jgi:Protein of unknown function (DUF2867)
MSATHSSFIARRGRIAAPGRAWSPNPRSRFTSRLRYVTAPPCAPSSGQSFAVSGDRRAFAEWLTEEAVVGMRVKAAGFQKLDLRCHALLSDVPLHDVWAIPLNGGGPGRTIQDARAALFGDRRPHTNLAVRGLFALRFALGRAFGWDAERHDPPGVSYIHRLSEADRAQSQVAPGTRDGPFRVLYVFGNEAVYELRNATVHAFLALVLTPGPGGYTLYLAIYVTPVSRFTALYMALIDPFRRLIVYPDLGRHAQQRWSRTYA